jgi:hypothetical protein
MLMKMKYLQIKTVQNLNLMRINKNSKKIEPVIGS